VNDESRLQVTPSSSRGLLKARSGLIARGLQEAAKLETHNDPWLATRRLAEQGDTDAQYEIGWQYAGDFDGRTNEDYASAARWFRKASEQGHARAQHQLGRMYLFGTGVIQNYTEALKWFRKAAEQGDASAQESLGVMYYLGQGIGRDYGEAANWFRMAAEQGDTSAQYKLGVMYYLGEGVPQDYIHAHMWSNLAARSFVPGTFNRNLDLIARQMTPQQIVEAQRLSHEWKAKATNSVRGEDHIA
jgi:TPR repeat protein